MWSVIGSHLKALETHAVNEKFSHSSWIAFHKAFDEYYNNVQQTFSMIFQQEKLLNQPIDAKNLVRRVASMHLM